MTLTRRSPETGADRPGTGSTTVGHPLHRGSSRPPRLSLVAPAPPVWTDRMRAVVRIIAGVIFISAGTTKLFGYPPPPQPLPPIHLASELGVAALLEIVGGSAIVLGLFTRPVAFVLAGEMAVAYFQAHFPQSFFPTTNGGMPAVLYCLLFLYLSFAGAGAWSIDALLARSSAADEEPLGARAHSGG